MARARSRKTGRFGSLGSFSKASLDRPKGKIEVTGRGGKRRTLDLDKAYLGRLIRRDAKLAGTGGHQKVNRIKQKTELIYGGFIDTPEGKAHCKVRVFESGKMMGFCGTAKSGDTEGVLDSGAMTKHYDQTPSGFSASERAAAAGRVFRNVSRKAKVWSKVGVDKSTALKAAGFRAGKAKRRSKRSKK